MTSARVNEEAAATRINDGAGDTAGPPSSRAAFWLILAGLTVIYIIAVSLESRRFVWFDELFTLDIAQSPSLHQLWDRVLRFDNNPPAVFLLSRLSMAVFGPTPFGLRFPSMVEFYFGSLAIFLYARRKAGIALACFAVLLLWGSATFYYATEARVYALVFMSFAFLLLSWDTAAHGERRKLGLFGVATSTTVLLCAHVFAPLSLFPFLGAEAVRFRRRRKSDYALWAALLLPMVVMVVYIPLIRQYSGIIIQPQAQASWRNISEFFFNSFSNGSALAIVALLALPATRQKRRPQPAFLPEDLAALVCLLLNPILLDLVLMHAHGKFFGRYCITTSVAIYLAIALLLALRLSPGRAALGAASLVMIATLARGVSQYLKAPRLDSIPWASQRPDLPIVDGDGGTFFEMNHHESPEVLGRLYYLKDRAAALKYTHTNYFEDFEAPDDMKKAGFPITAKVEPYSRFVHEHHEFLVYGRSDDWVLRLLHDDGATAVLLGDYSGRGPYEITSRLYLITMPSS